MSTKRFSRTKSITKQNLQNVPSDKPGIYRIKNNSDAILYIGKAKGGRLPDRIAEHKGQFKNGTKFQYIATSSKEEADKLERREIQKYNPLKNKIK